MFPTEERERWKLMRKERKAQGVEPVKKKQIIEEHYDDCGTDLSGLDGASPQELSRSWCMAELRTVLEASASED